MSVSVPVALMFSMSLLAGSDGDGGSSSNFSSGPCTHIGISSDGRQSATVCPDDHAFSYRDKASVVPYGTTPNWQNTLRRQVASVKIADVDGDGDNDLVIGCYTSNSFPPYDDWHNMIYRNVGGQLEANPSWISTDQVHTGEVLVADINHDGYQDIFSANGGSAHSPSVIYFGAPGGPSTSPGWTSVISPSTWSTSAIAFDFNHDGYIDIVTTNESAVQTNPYRPVYMFVNHNGALETTPSWQSAEASIQNGLDVADYDGDGWEDLGVAKWVNFQSAIYRNIGGTLQTVPVWTSGLTGGAHGAAFADIDGNGLLDIVFGYDPSRLFSQTSPGSFTNNWTSTAPFPGVQELEFFDVDGDGDQDLAEINFSTGRCHIYLNTNGTLPTTPSWTYDSPLVGNALAFGDINGDNRPDLAIGYSGMPSVVVFYAIAPPCPADVTHNGTINIDDLVAIITHWGSNDPAYDISVNGIVDIDDLVQVITHWGACP